MLLRDRFTYEGKKLLSLKGLDEKSDVILAKQLTAELNLAITGEAMLGAIGQSDIHANRGAAASALPGGAHQTHRSRWANAVALSDITVLDVLHRRRTAR